MAKTTTTSKAKTKTTKSTKKPATAAAKTTKSTVTAKKAAAKKAPVKVTSTKVVTPINKTAPAKVVKTVKTGTPILNRAQVLLGVVFAGLATLAGFFMNNESVQVLFSHLTKDELASRTGTVLAPAAHVLYEVEYRWLVVAMLAVLAVLAVLRGTKYFAREESAVQAKVAPLRWIDYAVTSAFAFTIAGLLNGVQDGVALKFGVVSLIVAALLGWAFERETAVDGKAAKVIYGASLVMTAVPVLMLAATMYATWFYGMVRSPWYAYAAAAVFALSVLLTTRMQWRNKQAVNYGLLDRGYNRLAVFSKVAFAVVLIVGLYK